MPTAKMCPHTVTIFNCTGEDEDGHALYQAAILTNVHVIQQEGEAASSTMDDQIKVYIFDENFSATSSEDEELSYLEYREFMKMNDTVKKKCFTLNPSGQDYVALGTHDTIDGYLPEPEDLALYEVKKVSRTEIGSRRMWHWEVIAL